MYRVLHPEIESWLTSVSSGNLHEFPLDEKSQYYSGYQDGYEDGQLVLADRILSVAKRIKNETPEI